MAARVKQRRVAVVMAGGAGERFWPLSRRDRPKQVLPLVHDNETLLGEAVRRVVPLIPPEDVYVATGMHLVAAIRQAKVGVPDENVIAEPCKRNTAGCLAYATAHILAKYGGDGTDLTMAVLTADHTVTDVDAFGATVSTALDAAESEHALVTLGIVPTRPETGYGYIEIADGEGPLSEGGGATPLYAVRSFHEKPDAKRAEEFVRSGRFFWNAGLFFWNIATFLDELAAASPPVAASVQAMATAMRAGDDGCVARVFEGLDDISIDYALMERASRVLVVQAGFTWDDVGAWTVLDRIRARDGSGNVLVGNPLAIDCRDSIIYNDAGGDMAVSVVGMEDVVVIATRDAVLVTRKGRAQEVREAVAQLKQRGARQV